MQKSDGMNCAPKRKSAPVCRKGEFLVGVIGLDHGHISGACNGFVDAGAGLAGVYDPDPALARPFREGLYPINLRHLQEGFCTPVVSPPLAGGD